MSHFSITALHAGMHVLVAIRAAPCRLSLFCMSSHCHFSAWFMSIHVYCITVSISTSHNRLSCYAEVERDQCRLEALSQAAVVLQHQRLPVWSITSIRCRDGRTCHPQVSKSPPHSNLQTDQAIFVLLYLATPCKPPSGFCLWLTIYCRSCFSQLALEHKIGAV